MRIENCRKLSLGVVVDLTCKKIVKIISNLVKFLVVVDRNKCFLSVFNNDLQDCVLAELLVRIFLCGNECIVLVAVKLCSTDKLKFSFYTLFIICCLWIFRLWPF